MKKYGLLLCVLATILISCDGKRRPWDESPTEQPPGEQSPTDPAPTDPNTPPADAPRPEVPRHGTPGSPETPAPAPATKEVPTDESDEPEDTVPVTTFADVKPIFAKHCALCHYAHANPPDWQDYEQSKKLVDDETLKYRIQGALEEGDDESLMPRNDPFKITQEERDLIVKWIDDGRLK